MAINAHRVTRSKKPIESTLYVLVQIGGDFITAGTLNVEDAAGQFLGTFTYAPSYLERARQGHAFALDPVNLPLRHSHLRQTAGITFWAHCLMLHPMRGAELSWPQTKASHLLH